MEVGRRSPSSSTSSRPCPSVDSSAVHTDACVDTSGVHTYACVDTSAVHTIAFVSCPCPSVNSSAVHTDAHVDASAVLTNACDTAADATTVYNTDDYTTDVFASNNNSADSISPSCPGRVHRVFNSDASSNDYTSAGTVFNLDGHCSTNNDDNATGDTVFSISII